MINVYLRGAYCYNSNFIVMCVCTCMCVLLISTLIGGLTSNSSRDTTKLIIEIDKRGLVIRYWLTVVCKSDKSMQQIIITIIDSKININIIARLLTCYSFLRSDYPVPC